MKEKIHYNPQQLAYNLQQPLASFEDILQLFPKAIRDDICFHKAIKDKDACYTTLLRLRNGLGKSISKGFLSGLSVMITRLAMERFFPHVSKNNSFSGWGYLCSGSAFIAACLSQTTMNSDVKDLSEGVDNYVHRVNGGFRELSQKNQKLEMENKVFQDENTKLKKDKVSAEEENKALIEEKASLIKEKDSLIEKQKSLTQKNKNLEFENQKDKIEITQLREELKQSRELINEISEQNSQLLARQEVLEQRNEELQENIGVLQRQREATQKQIAEQEHKFTEQLQLQQGQIQSLFDFLEGGGARPSHDHGIPFESFQRVAASLQESTSFVLFGQEDSKLEEQSHLNASRK